MKSRDATMTDLESGPLPVVYYTITDWDQHYEVNTENRAWRPGQDFRQGPIGYLRIKARRDWNHRLILLYQLVGEEMWAAIGMFEKLAQVVACEPRPHREGGIIRYSDRKPASLEQIAKMLLISAERASWLMEMLTHPDVGWVQRSNSTSNSESNNKSQFCAQGAICPTPAETGRNLPPPANPPKSARIAELRVSAESRRNPQKPADFAEKRLSIQSQVKSRTETEIKSNVTSNPRREDRTESAPSDLDKNLSRSHDSTRFAFLSALKTLLRPSTRADIQTLVNCWDWLDGEIGQGRAPPERRQEVLGLAADCQRGDVPISVFLSRMREQYAYVPPTRRTMQLRGECDV